MPPMRSTALPDKMEPPVTVAAEAPAAAGNDEEDPMTVYRMRRNRRTAARRTAPSTQPAPRAPMPALDLARWLALLAGHADRA